MIDTCQRILDEVDRSFVEFADMRIYTSDELQISVRKGTTENISSDKIEGIGIRALVKGAWGFASVASLEADAIRQTLGSAIKMAKGLSNSIKRPASINKEIVFDGRNEIKHDLNPRDISLEEKLELTQKVDRTLSDYDSQKIINSIARYSERLQREQIINTNGTHVVSDYGIYRLSAMGTSRSGDIIQNVSKSKASSAGIKSLFDWNIDEEMTNLGKRAVELLDAVSAPSGKMNVLLEPSLVGVYIHEAFGHGSEGDAILANKSVLTNQLGETLAIPEVSVIDDPTLYGLRGSFAYDSEGTPSQQRDIVKNGKLVGYLNDLTSSTMLEGGNTLNGAGRATDFRHMAMPRMGNTYIDNGSKSLEELAQEIGNGVYLKYSYGGYVNPSTGEFYFSSQSGYLIENGEITKPIRNSGMSGFTLDVLKNTIGVGNDLDLDAFAGVCGKGNLTGYQPMAVSAGGPHIAAKDIIVGGK